MTVNVMEDHDLNCVDIGIDGKLELHIARGDVGYAIDFRNAKGELLDGMETQVWDEDLEEGEE